MENIKRLLDEVKKAKGVGSDYALAKTLDLPKQRISDYYKGKTSPDKFACMKIAESLGKPLADVIYAVELDAEKDEARREAWKRYYKSIGGMAASAMLVGLSVVTFFVTPEVQAQERQGFESSKTDVFQRSINYAAFCTRSEGEF